MNKILIPTDFSVESLNVLKYVLEHHPDKKIHILLVHVAQLPDAITELLFFRKNVLMKSLISEPFYEAKAILTNKFYSKIHAIETDLYFGITHFALKNYIEAQGITEAYLPKNQIFKKSDSKSLNLIAQIKKVTSKITEVEMEPIETNYIQDSVASLFKY